MEKIDDKEIVVEKEKCVLCDKETEYTKDIHIDYRLHYIEGVGQLCSECYDDIYKEK